MTGELCPRRQQQCGRVIRKYVPTLNVPRLAASLESASSFQQYHDRFFIRGNERCGLARSQREPVRRQFTSTPLTAPLQYVQSFGPRHASQRVPQHLLHLHSPRTSRTLLTPRTPRTHSRRVTYHGTRMSQSLFDLSGKTAVVAGGTSGIGRTLALGLADAGADVVVVGRRQDAVHETAAAIEARGR